MASDRLLIKGMIIVIIVGIILVTLLVIAEKYVFAEETLPFPVYNLEKQNIYIQSETVNDFNEYNRQQREIDREYRMSQELNTTPAPPQNVTIIPDPPKHEKYWFEKD